ncbi:MAG: hypothetical protein EHM62_08320 [Methylococcus sp.]|nr:MAG: hypothetical protein EHM62_08320 [Methylococcus sp.]
MSPRVTEARRLVQHQQIWRFAMKITRSKAWLLVVLWLGCTAALQSVHGVESRPTADVYLFWKVGCPHCIREKDFLHRLKLEQPALRIHELEISGNPRSLEAFRAVIEQARIANPGVPLTVIGEQVIEGYNDDQSTGAEIQSRVAACLGAPCPD